MGKKNIRFFYTSDETGEMNGRGYFFDEDSKKEYPKFGWSCVYSRTMFEVMTGISKGAILVMMSMWLNSSRYNIYWQGKSLLVNTTSTSRKTVTRGIDELLINEAIYEIENNIYMVNPFILLPHRRDDGLIAQNFWRYEVDETTDKDGSYRIVKKYIKKEIVNGRK